MQRYFITPKQWLTDHDQEGNVHVILDGEDARHLSRVMRGAPGTTFIVSDGNEREAIAEWVEERDRQIIAVVREWLAMDHEPKTQVWIAQSLPKQDKMEMIIQKCTEIGAAGFIPFTSERTIVQYESHKLDKRMERWSKITKEAAEQAHRNRIPDIQTPISWKQLMNEIDTYDLVLFCYEQPGGASIREVLRDDLQRTDRPLRLLVVVGPEGGFTTTEADQMLSASAAKAITLGPRILRTETAAMVALACILHEFGEMGG